MLLLAVPGEICFTGSPPQLSVVCGFRSAMHEMAFRSVSTASVRLALSIESKPEKFISCSNDKTTDYISFCDGGLPCIFFL